MQKVSLVHTMECQLWCWSEQSHKLEHLKGKNTSTTQLVMIIELSFIYILYYSYIIIYIIYNIILLFLNFILFFFPLSLDLDHLAECPVALD